MQINCIVSPMGLCIVKCIPLHPNKILKIRYRVNSVGGTFILEFTSADVDSLFIHGNGKSQRDAEYRF